MCGAGVQTVSSEHVIGAAMLAFAQNRVRPAIVVYPEGSDYLDVQDCEEFLMGRDAIIIALDPELWKKQECLSFLTTKAYEHFAPLFLVNAVVYESTDLPEVLVFSILNYVQKRGDKPDYLLGLFVLYIDHLCASGGDYAREQKRLHELIAAGSQ
jgi:hypothetical protein